MKISPLLCLWLLGILLPVSPLAAQEPVTPATGTPAVPVENAAIPPTEKEHPAIPLGRPDLKWKTGGSWLGTHQDYVKRASQGKVNLVFFGDSLTQWWDWQDFKRRYNPLRGVNFAIGGDKTQNLLWRIQNGEMEGISPKLAVVLIGTNNLGSDSSAQIAEGIKAVVTSIQEKSPTTKVLLLGIFPRGWDGKQFQKKIGTINSTIARLDDGEMVRYADLGRHLLEPDGTLSREVSSDSLHLKAAGYRRWATAMQPLLEEMMGLPRSEPAPEPTISTPALRTPPPVDVP